MNPTLSRLLDAQNRHDADAMAALFAPGYRSEQPAHPGRGFGGSGQVAANWRAMFAGVPDMSAEVRAQTTDGSTVWAEVAWHGHHTDGVPFEMRGVTLFGIGADGRITWGRLYMEPVERDGAAIEEAVRSLAEPS